MFCCKHKLAVTFLFTSRHVTLNWEWIDTKQYLYRQFDNKRSSRFHLVGVAIEFDLCHHWRLFLSFRFLANECADFSRFERTFFWRLCAPLCAHDTTSPHTASNYSIRMGERTTKAMAKIEAIVENNNNFKSSFSQLIN